MTSLGPQTTTEVGGGPLTLLVPLGSTEQHGPHLPLDTDTRIATAVADAAAADRPDVVVAPALPYGASGEHAGFAGTLSIGTDALRHVLVELVRSLGPEMRRVVLVNGHGGNAEGVAAAVTQLDREGRDVAAWSPKIPGGDAHAGRTETSLLLAIAPGLVRADRAEAGERRPLPDLLPALRAGGVGSVSPNGVLGDPCGASTAEGRATLAELTADLAAMLDEGESTR